MRKTILFLLCSIFTYSTIQAQITKEQRKEREEITRFELSLKATEAARKEAQKLKKEGWTIAHSALPYRETVGQVVLDLIRWNYDAFKVQALKLAKQNLEKHGDSLHNKLDVLIAGK